MKRQLILILILCSFINGLMLQTDSFSYQDGILIVTDYELIDSDVLPESIPSESVPVEQNEFAGLEQNESPGVTQEESVVLEQEVVDESTNQTQNQTVNETDVEIDQEIDPMYLQDEKVVYEVNLNSSMNISDNTNFTIGLLNYYNEPKSVDIEAFYYYYSSKYSNVHTETLSLDPRSNSTYSFQLNLTEFRDGLKVKIKLKKSELVTWKEFRADLVFINLSSPIPVEVNDSVIVFENESLDGNLSENVSAQIELNSVVSDFDSVLESANESIKGELMKRNHSFLLNNTLENILDFEMTDFFDSIIDEVEFIDLEKKQIFMKSGANFTFDSASSDVELLNKWVGGSSENTLMSTLDFIEKSRQTKTKLSYDIILFALPFVLIGLGIFQKFWSKKRDD